MTPKPNTVSFWKSLIVGASLILAASLSLPAAALAAPVTYRINGTFDAPAAGSFSGVFTYDAATNTYSAVAVTSTPGLAEDGLTALPSQSFIYSGFGFPGLLTVATAVPATGESGMWIFFDPDLSTASPAYRDVYAGPCGTANCDSLGGLPSETRMSTTGLVAVLGAPVVTALAPASGMGATTVVITGADFTAATSVTFGGVAATSFTVDSNSQITAVAPVHAAGVANVVVTGPAGVSADTAADDFTYLAPPVVVPTLTEWAMILFGLILAGGAALTIQRRRGLI